MSPVRRLPGIRLIDRVAGSLQCGLSLANGCPTSSDPQTRATRYKRPLRARRDPLASTQSGVWKVDVDRVDLGGWCPPGRGVGPQFSLFALVSASLVPCGLIPQLLLSLRW